MKTVICQIKIVKSNQQNLNTEYVENFSLFYAQK